MGWRRAAGAAIMFLGAGLIMAVVAAAILIVAPYIGVGDCWNGVTRATLSAGWLMPAGVATLVAGRVLYGRWRMGAPVASFTGNIARTVGLISAGIMIGGLILLLATGLKHEDTPAAVALTIGLLLALIVAHLGSSLRGRGFPD